MKAASSGFITRLGLTEQSFCYLATITRKDGTVKRLADCVGNVVVGGNTYLGSPGFQVSSVTAASFGSPSSADMTVGLASDSPILASELQAGYYDGADIVVDMADYLSLTSGVMNVFTGNISQVEQVDTQSASLRLSGLLAKMLEIIVETYGSDCRAPFLGHTRCGVNIASFTHTAVVATVTDARNFTLTITAAEAVDGWFNNGAVEFTSGANNGLAFDIRSWTQSGAHVSLWLAPFGTVSVGDTLNIAPGCDKTATMCNAKFSNILNFQGFPLMPTASQLLCGDPATVWAERPPVGGGIVRDC